MTVCSMATFVTLIGCVRSARGLNRWGRRHCDHCGGSLIGADAGRCATCDTPFDPSHKITTDEPIGEHPWDSCSACGYDVGGLKTDRCPECGGAVFTSASFEAAGGR